MSDTKYFNNIKSREKINELTTQKITVDEVQYNFTDFIENEYISDFPTYSQRVRTIAQKVASRFDDYLVEVDGNLKLMEQGLNNRLTDYINTTQQGYESWETEKQNSYNEWERNKQETYNNWERDKQNAYNQWEQEKQQSYNQWEQAKQNSYNEWTSAKETVFNNKIENIDRRINTFDKLEAKTVATESQAGVITEGRVKELINTTVPVATDTRNGSISKNEVKNLALSKMKEFGIGQTTVLSSSLNTKTKPVGIYVDNTGTKLDNTATPFVNILYDNNWGVQLSITESDDPVMRFRSLRNGSFKNWKKVVTENDFITLDGLMDKLVQITASYTGN